MPMTHEEKMVHINAAEEVLDHELVTNVVEEAAFNLHIDLTNGLHKYALLKIAKYAATVARAQALNIDIDDLRSTPREHAEHAAHIAKKFTEAGKPVTVVIVPEEEQ